MSNPTRHRGSKAADSDGEDIDELVTALLTASRVLVGVSARSLAHVEDAVTLTQFRTLVVLDSHGEINLNRLAELLDVNSSTAMRMIDRLLVADLVTRRDNPANRREVLLGSPRPQPDRPAGHRPAAVARSRASSPPCPPPSAAH